MCIPIPEDFRYTPPPEKDEVGQRLFEDVAKRPGDASVGKDPVDSVLAQVLSPERAAQYAALPKAEQSQVDDAVAFWASNEYQNTVKRLTTVG